MHNPKIQVLATRKIGDELIARAASAGLMIDELPFIATEPVKSEVLHAQMSPFSGLHVTIVFTSANAVRAVAAAGIDACHWRIYCMSGATLRTARQYFPGAEVRASASAALDLAELILQDPAIRKVVFCCGNKRRDELPSLLHQHGVDVQEVFCYKTSFISQAIEKEYDALLFFSPSAVAGFLSANKITRQQIIFAIGPTTAAALAPYSDRIVVSKQPEAGVLIDKLISFYQADKTRYES